MKSYGGDNGRCIVKIRRKTFTGFDTPAKDDSRTKDDSADMGKVNSVSKSAAKQAVTHATPKTPLADGDVEVYWDDDVSTRPRGDSNCSASHPPPPLSPARAFSCVVS